MASKSRQVLLSIRGDATDARRALRETQTKLHELSREEASVRLDIETARAERSLEAINERIKRFRASGPVTKEVDLKIRKAEEAAALLGFKLDRLRLKRVTIDVDVKRGSVERASAALGTVERALSGAGRGAGGVPLLGGLLSAPFKLAGLVASALSALPGLLENIGSAATSAFQTLSAGLRDVMNGTTTVGEALGSVFSALASTAATGGATLLLLIPVVAALAVGMAALASAIGAVVGALGALAASITFAVAGAGALAVAVGAALGPALLVAVGFVKELVGALKDRKKNEQELTQAVQAEKTAEQQRQSALQASRQAHEQLAQATVDGNRAMRDSILEVRDAQLALDSSKLGVKEARLNLLEAKRALRDLLKQAGATGPSLNSLTKKFTNVDFDPSQAGRALGSVTGGKAKVDPLELQQRILAVQRAQLNVKDSIEQTAHAEQTLADATKRRAAFVREGIDAYKPYRQAVENVRKSDERLAQATNRLAQAQALHNEKLRQVAATQNGFIGSLTPFLKKLNDLAAIVTKPIFDGLTKAFASLSVLVSDPRIQGGLTAIGQAVGNFIAQFAKTLSTDAWRRALAGFAQDSARLITQGGRAFTHLATILRDIATAAMPALVRMSRDVADWLGRIASKPGAIHRAVQFVVAQFKTWLSIAGHLASIVLGFLRAARGSSQSLSGWINKLVAKFDHWINSKKGQQAVEKFLRQSVRHIQSLANELPGVLHAFILIAKVVNAIAKTTKDLVDYFDHLAQSRAGAGEPKKGGVKGFINGLLGFNAFASGGMVPGSGRGDTVPAMLEPGEFVLRRSVVQALSLPVLHALNGGGVPQLAPVGPSIGRQHVGDNHFTVVAASGRNVDPRSVGAALEREVWKGGLR